MAKFIKNPFATSGDKTTIPDAADPSGFVSWEEGYPIDYSRPYDSDPLAKPIERLKLNQALYDISSGVQQYQTHGVPDFITAADNGGVPYPYDFGARVIWTDGKIYVNQVNANTNDPVSGGWARENTSQNGSFKNKLINGDMMVSQRGDYTTATAATSGSYYIDRWKTFLSSVTADVQQLSASQPTGSNKKSLKYVATSSASGALGSYQRIDDIAIFFGSQVTLGAWVKSNSSNARIVVYDGISYTSSAAHSGGGTWEFLTVTASISASATDMRVWGVISSATLGAVSITSGDYIETSLLQFEFGPVATEYEDRPYSLELFMCRYYAEVITIAAGSDFVTTQATSTTTALGGMAFNAKRSAPSISILSGTINVRQSGGGQSSATITFSNSSNQYAKINVSAATGLVAGDAASLVASVESKIIINSEL